jgi:hypothetical protein
MDTSNSAKKWCGAYFKHSPTLTDLTDQCHPLTQTWRLSIEKKTASKGNLHLLNNTKHSLFCRLKVEEPDAEPIQVRPECEVPNEEAMFPLPLFHQTPGPISVSQSYL